MRLASARTSSPDIKFALQRVLRLGIILLGLRLSLQAVAKIGLSALVLVLVCISVALTLAYLAGRFFKIPARLALLIGVGTAICGNSAIIATAPVIEAKDEDVSFAVATITLFGTVAIVLYPIIGHALALSSGAFGMWAGSAVNDTSQVVAVGAAFSEAARDVATVVKLTRNTLMAPLIVIIGLLYARASQRHLTGKAAAATHLTLGQARAVVCAGLPGPDPAAAHDWRRPQRPAPEHDQSAGPISRPHPLRSSSSMRSPSLQFSWPCPASVWARRSPRCARRV